ncbi:hypothetical protein ACQEVG_07080 [Streptomyces sp. CA-135486]|uniref:golvesin C-terminal-like domain-containing protein n=1 Tax=Streptomyces sp. CA-135486 TaxID=3240049 RepID=UPI003D8DD284
MAATFLLIGSIQASAWADAPRATVKAVKPTVSDDPAEVPSAQRADVLGKGWKGSGDLAWTAIGDATGFHILTARQNQGYAWRTTASLSEPGFEADLWIGNVCLTASGKRAVVVYAPRTFTNKPELMARGAFTAVVDMNSGAVHKLNLQTSLAYHNPGCGAGENAVLSQSGGEDKSATRLFRLDTATGQLSAPAETRGQVTSAVPLEGGGIAAAAGAQIMKISADGKRTRIAQTRRVPYRLTPDAGGGLVFLDKLPSKAQDSMDVQTEVRRITAAQIKHRRPAATRPASLARGPVTATGLTRGGSTVFVTGEVKQTTSRLPSGVRRLQGVPKDSLVSTGGDAVLTSTAWADGKDSRIQPQDAAAARSVAVAMVLPGRGRKLSFTVNPVARPSRTIVQGGEASPKLKRPTGTARARAANVWLAAAGSPTNPVEDERVCSVPRNDPANQAMQPKPRQVEWAVDQGIMGNLKNTRPANWKNLGMPAYQPQTLFPPPALEGGGRIPAQVMLGVTAQESNMWQAARMTVPGVTGNPLIGNFYGINYYDGNTGNDWDVDWSKADCGYGVTQVTDHMRKAGFDDPDHGGAAWPYQTQRAVALDYTANIAAGLQILASKWNETRKAGLVINDGDPSRLENWFFALWIYNAGFHQNTGSGPWGVGWANNPANPDWDAARLPFMEDRLGNDHYADAAKPQNWPYPEKVIGFAAHPLEAIEAHGKMVAGFRAAWWNGTSEDATVKGSAKYNRARAKPPEDMFCSPQANECDPSRISDDASNDNGTTGPCGRGDSKCWWHIPVTYWKSDCNYSCGRELVRFDNTYPEEPDGTAYPPNCSVSATASGNAAPPGALIVDDTTAASVRPNCPRPAPNAGTFTFTFTGSSGVYPSKVDLHQLGAGFGGHFYFGHTRTLANKGDRLEFSGTWKLNAPRNEWMRIAVHLPDHGAHTQQARYDIDTGNGSFTKTRYINQKRRANNWVSLGVHKINGTPRVKLSTLTQDGTGDEDIAFDAVAFQPLPGKPKHIVAALGDSYSSGEGTENYYKESDDDHGNRRWNACRRSITESWPRKMVLPGQSTPLGQLSDAWSAGAELGFVACSGAKTWNVLGDGVPFSWDTPDNYAAGEGQFHEMSQVESGVLDEDTTLVTLSIGGNDGGAFQDAVINCYAVGVCKKEDYTGRIDAAVVKTEEIIRRIADPNHAKNAQIVLMGYPRIVAEWSCEGAAFEELNGLADYVAAKQSAMVAKLKTQGIKVAHADPIPKFKGHGLCDSSEWLNRTVIGPEGDGDFHENDEVNTICMIWTPGSQCLSRESFHPKPAGTTGYAQFIEETLQAIGYTGS